ncbi:MAG: tetratricopeptide repeat protein [Gammaproteobacteria bacterium]|nr:tetratricopeptide repeat protein [Gammaproteobacteria bacterium]
MDELLTDQQQAEIAKKWLRENGGFIFGGILLGLGALYGWNWWGDYQDGQAIEASALYEQVLEAVDASRPVRAAELQAELAAQFAGSPYVDQGRLAMAKLHMNRNEADDAASYLEQIVDQSRDDLVRPVARQRLARVRLHQQKYDEALAALDRIDENSAFASRSHEIRGDIYAAQNMPADARREYESALNTVEPGVIDRSYVQAKLDALPAVDTAISMDESAATESSAPEAETAAGE